MKSWICTLITSLFVIVLNIDIPAQSNSSPARAGLRSSVYGFDSFPDTTWWLNATIDMASRFDGASPSVIWILGYTTDNGCYLNFPNPNPATSFPKMSFSSEDENESYLDFFDRKGISVWLQVEPGFADVLTIIDLALSQYAHHPCVIGFGVDVEWYKTSLANNNEGEAVTDSAAEAWGAQIKSYNENYLLFTKHWLINKMPPTFRTDMVFVDDSQIFSDMDSMIDEFEVWSKAFEPAKVAFQYGYSSDKVWWSKLADPPKVIGDELLNKCSNVSDLYWVDFTAYEIWPEDFIPTSASEDFTGAKPIEFNLAQNYPNPFNPGTIIKFSLKKSGNAKIIIYDMLGRIIEILLDKQMSAGKHEIYFNADNLSAGIYYYSLYSDNFMRTKKMILLK